MDLCVTVLITVMTTGFRALVSLLHNYVCCQQAWGEPKLLEYPARLFASAGAWILPNTHILGKTSAFPKRKGWASATKNALGPGISGSLKIGREGKDLQNALAGCTHSTCAPSFLWVTSYFTSVQIRMGSIYFLVWSQFFNIFFPV